MDLGPVPDYDPSDNVWRFEPPRPEPLPSRVYLWNTKDPPLKVVEPTLSRLGADFSRITRQVTIHYAPERYLPAGELYRDRVPGCLTDALKRMPECRALIVDAIKLRLRKGELDQVSQGLLEALAKVAAARRMAVIAVVCMPQKQSGKSLERAVELLASSPVVDALWRIEADRWLPSRRYAVPVRNVFGAEPHGLAFELDEAGRVAWRSEPVDSARLRLGVTGAVSAEALDRLREVLAEGPLEAKELMRLARENGFSSSTLRRVKQVAGVVSRKEEFGAGWKWELAAGDWGLREEHDSHSKNQVPGSESDASVSAFEGNSDKTAETPQGAQAGSNLEPGTWI